jgi:predicted GIY-YIG superfamily endonuclease
MPPKERKSPSDGDISRPPPTPVTKPGQKKKKEKVRFHFCYLLMDEQKSYIGYSVNPVRRLRQHRREIKGGAKRTRRYGDARLRLVVGPFADARTAHQFEYAWQHGRSFGYTWRGRVKKLYFLLSLKRWSKQSPDVRDISELTIHWLDGPAPVFQRGYEKPKFLIGGGVTEHETSIERLPTLLYPDGFVI